jgi:hypothetical protein
MLPKVTRVGENQGIKFTFSPANFANLNKPLTSWGFEIVISSQIHLHSSYFEFKWDTSALKSKQNDKRPKKIPLCLFGLKDLYRNCQKVNNKQCCYVILKFVLASFLTEAFKSK